jgi:hypothetical protein
VVFNTSLVGVWSSLVSKLTSGPSLRALEWDILRWTLPDFDGPPSPVSGLRNIQRIAYNVREVYPKRRGIVEATRIQEQAGLHTVLEAVSPSLKYLRLTNDSVNFKTTSTLDWSSLNELVLVGYDTAHDDPLVVLLAQLPRLRVLNVMLQRSTVQSQPRFLVWPPNYDCLELMPYGRKLFPDLESFSLSNAHPADLVLRHLPPTLNRLSLVLHPKYFTHDQSRESVIRTGVMTVDEIITLLTRADVSSLTTLQLSVIDTLNITLFRAISDACPILDTLEVNWYLKPPVSNFDESCVHSSLHALYITTGTAR